MAITTFFLNILIKLKILLRKNLIIVLFSLLTFFKYLEAKIISNDLVFLTPQERMEAIQVHFLLV